MTQEKTCLICQGTILPPSIGGAKRGTCHCQAKANQVPASAVPLKPLCRCPKCGAFAICELNPEQRLAQPDDTTHVCHPLLGGCNHGFTDDRTRPTTTKENPMSKKTAKKQKAAQAETPKIVEEKVAEAPKVAEEKTPKAPKPLAFEPEGEVRAVKAGSKLAALIDALVSGTTLEELAQVLSQTGSKVDPAGVRSWITYDLRKTGLGIRTEGDRLFLVGIPLAHKTKEAKVQLVTDEPMKKAAMSSKRSKKAHATTK